MPYIAEATIDALRTSSRLGVYFRMDTVPPLRLWMGANDCPAGIDGIDEAGAVYLGAGRLLGIPEIDLMVNGQADQITLGISGVDPVHVAALSAGAPDIRGASVIIGFSPIDDNWQPVGSIIPIWRGRASHWTAARAPVTEIEKNAVHTISVTVAVGDQGRAQHKGATFTSGWQASRSSIGAALDRFFERIPRYVQGYLVAWPRY